MACVRIAAVVIAVLLSVELSAQPAPQGSVTIRVTDPTGAVVPGARIEIDPTFFKPGPVFSTDRRGQTALDLSEGSHVLLISGQRFERWMRSINVQNGTSQMLIAKLEILGVSSPTVAWEPEIRLDVPKPVSLPLQPLLNFDPLPSLKAKRHW